MGWNLIYVVFALDQDKNCWIASKCIECGIVSNKHIHPINHWMNHVNEHDIYWFGNQVPPPDSDFSE